MPEFDPSTNGHRVSAARAASRGNGVLLLTLVCAFTGLNMLLGAGLGVLVGAAVAGGGEPSAYVALAGTALGGIVGVALGVRVAARFGGTSGRSSVRWLTGWGLAGLVGSVALASQVTSAFTPIVAILLPGLLALIGDRWQVRRHEVRTGSRKPRTKLKDQEASD